MCAKKKDEWNFVERMRLFQKAGIAKSRDIQTEKQIPEEMEYVGDINAALRNIMGIIKPSQSKPGTMIYLIMYDIEHNKIRTYIAKYLEEKQCVRIQKSIFMAQTEYAVFNEIYQTLKEVQEVYDNNDSILLVPIATDQLRALKAIGQNIDFELFQGNKNTLFF